MLYEAARCLATHTKCRRQMRGMLLILKIDCSAYACGIFTTLKLLVYLDTFRTSLAATPPSQGGPIPSQPFSILDIVKCKFTALRFRTQFRHVRRKPFSQARASSIAFDAGLKNRRSKLVWVGATVRAEAEGQSVRDDEHDAYYRSVPWSCLSLDLRQSLSDLLITGEDETQSVDDDHREEIEKSGRRLSSECRFFSGGGLGDRDQGLGHGYVSSFKPRLLGDDDLQFIRDVLRYFTSRGEGHRRGTHSFGSNAGGYAEAREAVQGEHELNQPKDDVEDTICLETFASFCRWWWEPVMTTLARISEEWASDRPVRVHGFIGRLEAKRKLLKTGQPGVFLLRFSESRPGHLILASTYEVSKCTHHFLFTAPENARRKQNCSSHTNLSTKR